MQTQLRLLACLVPILLTACGGSQNAPVQATQLASRSSLNVTPPVLATAAYQDVVQRLYVAYFGRPADVSGLDFWSGQFQRHGMPATVSGFTDAYTSDATVRLFVDAFGASQESADLYPGTNAAFVDAVYRNLFNRETDAQGKAFWVSALDRGIITRPVAAFNIMSGAQSTDIDIIAKKVAVAQRFTAALDNDARRDAYDGLAASASARTMLGTVGLATDAGSFEGISTTLAELVARLGTPLHYLDFLSSGNGSYMQGLHLLPSTGGSTIDTGPFGDKQIAGTLFSAPLQNGAAAAVTQDSTLFWQNDRLYRQPLISHGNVPRAVVVSTLTANEIYYANSEAFTDLQEPSRSWIFFSKVNPDLPGGDEPGFAAVRMDMSNTTPALHVKKPLFAIRTPDGAISGFLVQEGLEVQRVDASFGNPVTMFTSAGGIVSVADVRQVGNMYFYLAGHSAYAWDAQSSTPGEPTDLRDGDFYGYYAGFLGVDPEHTYFYTREADKVSVRVYPHATRVPATVGVLPVPGQTAMTLHMTANYIVMGEKYGAAIWTLPRSGGMARRLTASTPGQYMPPPDIAGERIWFTSPAGLNSINTDGTGLSTISGGIRAGCVYRANILFQTENDVCESMLVLENDTLRGYNARTGALEVTYGALGKSSLTNMESIEANPGRGSDGQGMIFKHHATNPVSGLTEFLGNWYFVAGRPGLTPVAAP